MTLHYDKNKHQLIHPEHAHTQSSNRDDNIHQFASPVHCFRGAGVGEHMEDNTQGRIAGQVQRLGLQVDRHGLHNRKAQHVC